MSSDESRLKFGKRVQRCYGCFVAFYMKDMYLGEDATYYCENCKNDSMFHFDDFSRALDLTKLPGADAQDDQRHQGLSPRMTMSNSWPESLPAVQCRIARPTNRLDDVVKFYRDGLGLEVIGQFEEHAGYSGIMLGLPGHDYHLEFTSHAADSPCPAPTKDNLLVFYIPNLEAIGELSERLNKLGYFEVPPENPYWEKQGVTFEDPDGWRVVLMNTTGI